MSEQLNLPGVDASETPSPDLTEWRDGPPPMTGWWETRRDWNQSPYLVIPRREQRRWYSIDGWSMPVYDADDLEHVVLNEPANNQHHIQWRGLCDRPVTGYMYPLLLIESYWQQGE